MLYILTAPQQTGKTRWLEALIAELDDKNIPAYGVVAPGRWQQLGEKYLKLGIDNILLPTHERFSFATKAADASGTAGLGWAFSNDALDRVNAHFRKLAGTADDDCRKNFCGILVVDELGPLELTHGAGLVEALALLAHGPRPSWPHAIAVVRPSLVASAVTLLKDAWGAPKLIQPTEATKSHIINVLLASQKHGSR